MIDIPLLSNKTSRPLI